MKGKLYIASLFLSLPLMAWAQSDVYYIPSKKVKTVVTTTNRPSVSSDSRQYDYDTQEVKAYNSQNYIENRDVDEYNRRSRNTETYADNNSQTDTRSQSYDEREMDNYNYSKRIVRFYSPRPGIMISSPYYWDICYSDVWDVYYDTWAFALPSYVYWSCAYDPWIYNRWWYRSCWDYTWGWYDPFWGHSYWGWHRPLYWGWHRPCYGGWAHSGHHFNPHWYRPIHNPGGGRHFAHNNNYKVTTGSAGGRIVHGSFNNRSQISNRPSSGRTGLDKSFRTGSFNNNVSQTSPSYNNNNGSYQHSNRGGGGFSRSSSSSRAFSNTNSSQSQSSYNSRSNSTSRGYQSSDNKTQSKTYTPDRSYNSNSSSSSRSSYGSSSRSSSSFSGGGGFSRGGGSSHSGGGGFSRGGGGRR